jgi:hypothetical protein
VKEGFDDKKPRKTKGRVESRVEKDLHYRDGHDEGRDLRWEEVLYLYLHS